MSGVKMERWKQNNWHGKHRRKHPSFGAAPSKSGTDRFAEQSFTPRKEFDDSPDLTPEEQALLAELLLRSRGAS